MFAKTKSLISKKSHLSIKSDVTIAAKKSVLWLKKLFFKPKQKRNVTLISSRNVGLITRKLPRLKQWGFVPRNPKGFAIYQKITLTKLQMNAELITKQVNNAHAFLPARLFTCALFPTRAYCLKMTQNVSFEFLNFGISNQFFLWKLTYLVTLFKYNFGIFKNSPKRTIFDLFNELLSTQNANVARFARNIKWDFFCNFSTLCFSG